MRPATLGRPVPAVLVLVTLILRADAPVAVGAPETEPTTLVLRTAPAVGAADEVGTPGRLIAPVAVVVTGFLTGVLAALDLVGEEVAALGAALGRRTAEEAAVVPAAGRVVVVLVRATPTAGRAVVVPVPATEGRAIRAVAVAGAPGRAAVVVVPVRVCDEASEVLCVSVTVGSFVRARHLSALRTYCCRFEARLRSSSVDWLCSSSIRDLYSWLEAQKKSSAVR